MEVIEGPSIKSIINIDEELALSMATEDAADIDTDYGLLEPEQIITFRAYSDDGDDQLLEDLSPRFIIMYEPNLEFIRRIEVSLACHTHKYILLMILSTSATEALTLVLLYGYTFCSMKIVAKNINSWLG